MVKQELASLLGICFQRVGWSVDCFVELLNFYKEWIDFKCVAELSLPMIGSFLKRSPCELCCG